MPSSNSAEIHFSLIASINEIDRGEWQLCAGSEQPFLAHAFFKALEDSGSVGEQTGWIPRYLIGRDHEGTLQAAMPLFAKTHSYGEYVFDWSWAEAYQKAGGHYYPKWQCAIPFTPVPGPRLLGSGKTALARALISLCGQTEFSSAHATFIQIQDEEALVEAGFHIRQGMQYHWHNRDYGSFEDFLQCLNSRKRKMIKKERMQLKSSGIEIAALTGGEITESHWDFFYRCYLQNAKNKWGKPYLTRSFFSLLGQGLSQQVVLMLARREGRDIAAALNLRDQVAIYGRNWGAIEEHAFLHFETCYYAAIEYAIQHGLKRVEAGAQGEHKIPRGYEPVTTKSAHYFPDPNFAAAIADFLRREARMLDADRAALTEFLPYHQH